MKQLAFAFAALILTACGGSSGGETHMRASQAGTSGGLVSGCKSRAYPEIGGPISLIDQTGRAVTEADYKGAPTMVFFGFTYCPGVCPITLTTLKRAYTQLPRDIQAPKTLLISIDPQRDTPDSLSNYIDKAVFPDDLDGLTGTPAQVRSAADAFVADFSRVEQDDSLAGYTMDHTTLIYLMDENWQLKTFFTHEDTAETIAACLKQQLG